MKQNDLPIFLINSYHGDSVHKGAIKYPQNHKIAANMVLHIGEKPALLAVDFIHITVFTVGLLLYVSHQVPSSQIEVI